VSFTFRGKSDKTKKFAGFNLACKKENTGDGLLKKDGLS